MNIRSHFSLARRLPEWLRIPLCGKREFSTQGRDPQDFDWLAWKASYMKFYQSTQKSGMGKLVNDAGYQILSKVDISGLACLEIGPGTLPHMPFWHTAPARFDLVDINQEMLDASSALLREKEIPSSSFLSGDAAVIPVPDASYDALVTFYSLEHLYPLDAFLSEYMRVLKPNGLLIGAIPAEGGLAWGLGRMLTSRRYTRKHFTFDFDKITAWEHCNTAEDILTALDVRFILQYRDYWPLRVPLIDTNLVIRFIYRKSSA